MAPERGIDIQTLGVTEIARCARHALALLAAYPLRWLLLIIVFFVVVESLMFIPYIGFVAKMALAGLLGAQMLVLFSGAAAGQPPKPSRLFGVFSLLASAQLVLVLTALVPFIIGLAYLVAQGGGLHSVAYFFGNILTSKPPAPDVFFIFKIILYIAGLPLMFIPAAVVLRGLSGSRAVAEGVRAAVRNWPAALAYIAPAIFLEWLVLELPVFLPRTALAVLAVVAVVILVAWSFSFLYALSAHVFGVAAGRVQPGDPCSFPRRAESSRPDRRRSVE